MKISFSTIGKISFVAEERTYVAEVALQTKDDDRLTGMQKISSHDIEMTIRIKGDASWPFERVQQEILTEAASLLNLACEHLRGATPDSLERHNEEIDREQDQASSEQIAQLFHQPSS